MANQLDADVLYEYLVLGRSQSDIAADYGITQRDVSNIVHFYHFNEGNVAFGKGAKNQCGKYPNLDFDTLCDFMDSGEYSLDAWLNGDGGYEDDEEYYEEDDGYVDDNYGQNDNNGYNNGGYSAPQQPQYRNGRKVTYVNPDDIPDDDYPEQPEYRNGRRVIYVNPDDIPDDDYPEQPEYRNGRKVTYVNPDDYDDDGNYVGSSSGSSKGRMLLIIAAIIILGGGWLFKNYSDSSVILASLTVLWQTKYLLFGLLPGVIFGVLKYLSCRSLRETLSTCGTWAWLALGLIAGGIAFFIKFASVDSGAALATALVMIVPGAIIGLIGYKLFYR